MGLPQLNPSDPSKVMTTPFAMPNMLSAEWVESSDWLNPAVDGSLTQGAGAGLSLGDGRCG